LSESVPHFQSALLKRHGCAGCAARVLTMGGELRRMLS
jgi:hypothetical protein